MFLTPGAGHPDSGKTYNELEKNYDDLHFDFSKIDDAAPK